MIGNHVLCTCIMTRWPLRPLHQKGKRITRSFRREDDGVKPDPIPHRDHDLHPVVVLSIAHQVNQKSYRQ
jgi:hypothetical protein